MGLLVVARLAVRHGLTVRLNSQQVRGTTAIVVLPERLLTAASAPTSSNGAGGLPWAGSRSAVPAQRTVASQCTDPPPLPDPDQIGTVLSGLWQGLDAARRHRPQSPSNREQEYRDDWP
jgi:hypothetical protein